MKKIYLLIFSTYLTINIGFAQVSLKQVWETSNTELKTPESVIYNEKNNLLYVSNINGEPTSKDGNGFISIMTTVGKIEKLEWIKGLDAPKGMGILNNKLYVADITKLVIIDIEKSVIEKTIEISGSQFLNDITISNDGVIYISDSFSKKVYTYSNGEIKTWLDGTQFKKPNGLLAEKNAVKLMDFDAGILYDVDYKSGNQTVVAKDFPQGGDEIVNVDKDEYIISLWPGEIYYLNKDVKTKLLDSKEQKINTADLWYIKKLNLVLVPTFFANKVIAYQLVK